MVQVNFAQSQVGYRPQQVQAETNATGQAVGQGVAKLGESIARAGAGMMKDERRAREAAEREEKAQEREDARMDKLGNILAQQNTENQLREAQRRYSDDLDKTEGNGEEEYSAYLEEIKKISASGGELMQGEDAPIYQARLIKSQLAYSDSGKSAQSAKHGKWATRTVSDFLDNSAMQIERGESFAGEEIEKSAELIELITVNNAELGKKLEAEVRESLSFAQASTDVSNDVRAARAYIKSGGKAYGLSPENSRRIEAKANATVSAHQNAVYSSAADVLRDADVTIKSLGVADIPSEEEIASLDVTDRQRSSLMSDANMMRPRAELMPKVRADGLVSMNAEMAQKALEAKALVDSGDTQKAAKLGAEISTFNQIKADFYKSYVKDPRATLLRYSPDYAGAEMAREEAYAAMREIANDPEATDSDRAEAAFAYDKATRESQFFAREAVDRNLGKDAATPSPMLESQVRELRQAIGADENDAWRVSNLDGRNSTDVAKQIHAQFALIPPDQRQRAAEQLANGDLSSPLFALGSSISPFTTEGLVSAYMSVDSDDGLKEQKTKLLADARAQMNRLFNTIPPGVGLANERMNSSYVDAIATYAAANGISASDAYDWYAENEGFTVVRTFLLDERSSLSEKDAMWATSVAYKYPLSEEAGLGLDVDWSSVTDAKAQLTPYFDPDKDAMYYTALKDGKTVHLRDANGDILYIPSSDVRRARAEFDYNIKFAPDEHNYTSAVKWRRDRGLPPKKTKGPLINDMAE